MAANGISTLTIPTGITATSFTGSYPVAAGTFNYDSYGAGFSIRQDGGSADAYIAQVLALPALSARNYVFDQIDPVDARPFTYGQALINFTLNANGTFSNVVCTYGAGGYSASSGQLTMLGTQLLGGVSPGNDILWDYVCAGNDGVITSFTYASGTPPVGRLWTFVPANGDPSFTRAMQTPAANVELPGGIIPTWNIATAGGINLGGTGTNELDPVTTPAGTSFNIYATELGGAAIGADKEARQIAKLTIAQAKRQGKVVATNGTISGSIDPTKSYYRSSNIYNLPLLPTQYDGFNVVDNANSGGLVEGRPWTAIAFASIPTTINEGSAGTFNVTTSNVVDGTTLYWTIETNAGDFGTTSGSFTITSDAGSFTVTPTADVTTEGPEAFTVAVRTVSTSGLIVTTSSLVYINDTSVTPPSGVDNITGYAQMTSSPPLNHPEDFSHTNYTTNEPTGFTFTSPGSPGNGFAVSNLSLSNTAWFDTHPTPTTITWGPGSTVASSSITVDYYGPGPNPGKTIVVSIIGQVGSATYNFPFTWS